MFRVSFLSELFAYIWYLIIVLSSVTTFTIFRALYKHCLIYPICLLRHTHWSGSSHESLGPQSLPLCFAACPQRPVFTITPHNSSTSSRFKKRWDRNLRLCPILILLFYVLYNMLFLQSLFLMCFPTSNPALTCGIASRYCPYLD